MGYGKNKKTEGGQGGEKGHSNMSHRDETEWVKEVSKVRRREDSKTIVRKEIEDLEEK